MRREAWGRDLMLVATSGWGQHDDVKRSIEAGFDWHLVKPVTISCLRDALRDGPHIQDRDDQQADQHQCN